MRKNFYDQSYDRESSNPSPPEGGSSSGSSGDASTLGGIPPSGWSRVAGRGSLPTPSEEYHEQFWFTPYANNVVGGRLYVCLRNDQGAYVWSMIVEG